MKDILELIVQEVAFEGLDGVPINNLWDILSNRINQQNQDNSLNQQNHFHFDHHLKQFYWIHLKNLPQIQLFSNHVIPDNLSLNDTLIACPDLHLVVNHDVITELIQGNHRFKHFSQNVLDILYTVVKSRENGVTQADLATICNKDSRSVFAFLKTLLQHNLVVKVPISSKGMRTSLIIHTRFAKLNPHYQTYLITSSTTTKTEGVIGTEDVTISTQIAPEILALSGEAIKFRICNILDYAKNKSMIEGDLADSLGYPVGSDQKARRNIFRQLEVLANDGFVDRFLTEPGKIKAVRLIKPYTRIKIKDVPITIKPEEELDLKKGLSMDLPLEHQIYNIIHHSGKHGITSSVIHGLLQNIHSRFLASILQRLVDYGKIKKVGEFMGREHRYRYYSDLGYQLLRKDAPRIKMDQGDEVPVEETPVETNPVETNPVETTPVDTPVEQSKKTPTKKQSKKQSIPKQPPPPKPIIPPPQVIQLDDIPCKICESIEDDDKMLLCDYCNSGLHLYCHDPPIENIPEGDWFCSDECKQLFENNKRQKQASIVEVKIENNAPGTSHSLNAIIQSDKATEKITNRQNAISSTATNMQRREILLKLLNQHRVLIVNSSLCKKYEEAFFKETGVKLSHKIDKKTLLRTSQQLEESKSLKLIRKTTPFGSKEQLLHFIVRFDLDVQSEEVKTLIHHLMEGSSFGKILKPVERPVKQVEVETLGELQQRLGDSNLLNVRRVHVVKKEEGSDYENDEDVVVGRLNTIGQRKINKQDPDEKLATWENGFIPGKMMRARLLHEWLFESIVLKKLNTPVVGFETSHEQEGYHLNGIFSSSHLITEMPFGIYRRIIGIVNQNKMISHAINQPQFERKSISQLPEMLKQELTANFQRFRKQIKVVVDVLVGLGILKALPKLDVAGNVIRPEISDFTTPLLSFAYQLRKNVLLCSYFEPDEEERTIIDSQQLKSFWQDLQKLNLFKSGDTCWINDDEHLWILEKNDYVSNVVPRQASHGKQGRVPVKHPLYEIGHKGSWDLIPTVRGVVKQRVDKYVTDYFHDNWSSQIIPDQGIKEIAKKVEFNLIAVNRRVKELELLHKIDLEKGLMYPPPEELEDGILKKKRKNRDVLQSSRKKAKVVVLTDNVPVNAMVLGPVVSKVVAKRIEGGHGLKLSQVPNFSGLTRPITVKDESKEVWALEEDEDLILCHVILKNVGSQDLNLVDLVLERTQGDSFMRLNVLKQIKDFEKVEGELLAFWQSIQNKISLPQPSNVEQLSKLVVYFRDCLRMCRHTVLDVATKFKVKTFPKNMALLHKFYDIEEIPQTRNEALPYEDKIDKEIALRGRLGHAYNTPLTARVSEDTQDVLSKGSSTRNRLWQLIKMATFNPNHPGKEKLPDLIKLHANDLQWNTALDEALTQGWITRKTKQTDRSKQAFNNGSLGLSDRIMTTWIVPEEKPWKLHQQSQEYFKVLEGKENVGLKPKIADGASMTILNLLADGKIDLRPTVSVRSLGQNVSSTARSTMQLLDTQVDVELIVGNVRKLKKIDLDKIYGKAQKENYLIVDVKSHVSEKDLKSLPQDVKVREMYGLIDEAGQKGLSMSTLLQHFGNDTRRLIEILSNLSMGNQDSKAIVRVGYDHLVYVSHNNLEKWIVQLDAMKHVLPHCWNMLDGTRDEKLYRRFLESVMNTIVKKPGIPLSRLTSRHSVLTRNEIFTLLEDLEHRACVKKMVLKKQKVGLWDDDFVHERVDENTANPEESISHFFPTTYWMKNL